MDIYVLNQSFEIIDVVDTYQSLIWTSRYYNYGDFEMLIPASAANLELLTCSNCLHRSDNEVGMIIDKIQIKTDSETGNYFIVSGKSFESILNRRIIWNQTSFSGTVENLIRKLINENAINPSDSARKINNLILGPSQGYSETIEKQITGDNLGEAISALCTTYGYGYKITLTDSKKLQFDLYKGVDHSYQQTTNPYVVFSPTYDNLINSNYEKNKSNFANVALVAGEGEGASRKTATVGTASGFDRYELFVDARDVSSNNGEETITPEKYNAMLVERGQDSLSERGLTEGFEGEVDTTTTYPYKEAWNLGDTVQVENEYGISASPQIIEVIESDSKDGYSIIPTFATWEV